MLTTIDFSKCLLCYEPPCDAACLKIHIGRYTKAVKMNNYVTAIKLLPKDENPCLKCDKPCIKACLTHIDIPTLIKIGYDNKGEIIVPPSSNKVSLECDICGIKLENPFLLSSSVVSSNYDMCSRAFKAGWAGAAFKTVCLMEIHEASPRFSVLRSDTSSFAGFKNIEQLSDHSLEENLECFKQLKKDFPNKVIIASIMGRNEEEWTYLSRKVSDAGADIVELNFSCPNMEDENAGVTIGQDPELVYRYTKAACLGTNKPVIAKMTPNLDDICLPARAAVKAGAKGIAAINTIKSITNVDLEKLVVQPEVQGKSSIGGYSGRGVKPIALRFISDLQSDPELKDIHVSGMGGVYNWQDAAEFLLMGADSIQITTAIMEYGYRIIDDLIEGLKYYMEYKEIHSVKDLSGKANKTVVEANQVERDTILYPVINQEKCIGCGRCYVSCQDGGHQAISFDLKTRRPKLNAKKCVGCHLCLLVCPIEIITPAKVRVSSRKNDSLV